MQQSMGSIYIPLSPSCDRCKDKTILIQDKAVGDMICAKCGQVLVSRMINQSPEWIDYENDDSSNGESLARTSFIDPKMNSIYEDTNTIFMGGSEEQRKRMERSQYLSSDPKERRIHQYMHIVKDMADLLQVTSSILNDAKVLFAKAIYKELSESKIKRSLAAACLYLACKQQGYPRTFDELSLKLGIEVAVINKTQSAIARALEVTVVSIKPSSLLVRMNNSIHLSPETLVCAQDICNYLEPVFEGSKPQSVAVLALTIASILRSHPMELHLLLEISHCSITHIQNQYITVQKSTDSIFPLEIRQVYPFHMLPKKLDKMIIHNITKGLSIDSKMKVTMKDETVTTTTTINPGSSTPNSDTLSSGSTSSMRKRPRPALFTAYEPASNKMKMNRNKTVEEKEI